ncbi:MAG: hypothetical protein QM235_10620 [Pseudomonadota bacterium]|jgi:hypothetical protein|nr:hypothetical protein [Pseudomonadota bacterium]
MSPLTKYFGNVIDTYTRANAIEDGVLIDITNMAKEAGIKYPVAVTEAVWSTYIVPDDRSRAYGQSEDGRLWDTLWMFRIAARRTEGAIMYFKLYFIMKERLKKLVTLKAVVHPGDDMKPVITIMLPEED